MARVRRWQMIPVAQQSVNGMSWERIIRDHEADCNVVYYVKSDKGLGKVNTVDPYLRAQLRRKYHRARRLVRVAFVRAHDRALQRGR